MVKERNYLFDNYKVLLIYLVVLGHFVSPSLHETAFLEEVKWFIFAFHMPAFMFVSGFFSKKSKSIATLIQKLIVPYLIFEFLYFGVYMIIGKETKLSLLYPKFTLWYLFALFMFKIAGGIILRLKLPAVLIMAGAILFSLVWGFSSYKGNFLTNQRAVYFFPFYLLGMYMNNEQVQKLRTSVIKKISWIVISLFILFLILDPIHKQLSITTIYGKSSYEELGIEPFFGILLKIICYAFGFILTLAFLSILSDKKTKFSWIGTNTMPVYLFHGLIFKVLEIRTHFLENLDTPVEIFLLFAGCALLTYILALEPINNKTNALSSISFKKFLKPHYR